MLWMTGTQQHKRHCPSWSRPTPVCLPDSWQLRTPSVWLSKQHSPTWKDTTFHYSKTIVSEWYHSHWAHMDYGTFSHTQSCPNQHRDCGESPDSGSREVTTTEDLSWAEHTSAVAGKAQQRLHFLRKLRRPPKSLLLTFTGAQQRAS